MAFTTSILIGKPAYLTTDESDDEVTVKKVGRVHFFVFDGKVCVGVLVKRPDAAMMFRRKDLFAPLSAIYFQEKAIIIDADYEAQGKAFLKENNINLNKTFVWDGMNVQCEDGRDLGVVDCVVCTDSGKLKELHVSDGITSDKLLGVRVLPKELVLGMRVGTGTARLMTTDQKEDGGCGVLAVKNEAASIKLSGGVAEKAAVGSVKAKEKAVVAAGEMKKTAGELKEKATPTAKKAAATASNVFDAGVKKAGRDFETTKKGVLGFKDNFMNAYKGALEESDSKSLPEEDEEE
ncbi:MAG: hypothetical protein Q3982_01045 [Phoenicibacter congonensis]|uniref:PRC-barrel domain-containing protein n=1 Tax=Phoenicibacter congonensis TaxID=1944646 RepID=A0AA43RI41_9ACTN|nr:hypothetical protein [Phoenicibacter congonensis]